MEILNKLIQNGSCSVDGTVSGTKNPFTKAIDSILDIGIKSSNHRFSPSQTMSSLQSQEIIPFNTVSQEQYNEAYHDLDKQLHNIHLNDQQRFDHFQQQPTQQSYMIRTDSPYIEEFKQERHLHNIFNDINKSNWSTEYYKSKENNFISNVEMTRNQFMQITPWVEEFHSAHNNSNIQFIHPPTPYPFHLRRNSFISRNNLFLEQSYHPPLHYQVSNHGKEETYYKEESKLDVEQNIINEEISNNNNQIREISAFVAKSMEENKEDPRWQKSEFLKFMKDVSNGNATIHNNKVDFVPNGNENALEGVWSDGRINNADANSFDTMWNDMNTNDLPDEKLLEDIWKRAIGESHDNNRDVFKDIWENNGGHCLNEPNSIYDNEDAIQNYEFEEENPHLDYPNPYEEGLRLFNNGQLKEAIRYFEASVIKENDFSDGWRMLGETHAEIDEDKKAIVSLETAVVKDPYNLDALLALGVSYVNELNSIGALKTLKSWIQNNPKFANLQMPDRNDTSQLMEEVTQLMKEAEKIDERDENVQVVLGILYNVTKEYDKAIACFQKAINYSSNIHNNYSLWNKLGATLANSNKSADAVPAYQRALAIKPCFARGLLNLGISYANLSDYRNAAESYLKAIKINPDADHIWSYLRIAFSCMNRFDLVEKTNQRSYEVFQDEFDLQLPNFTH